MLAKLRIIAYQATDRRTPIGFWSAQINPEAYLEAYRTVFREDRGIDTAGTTTRYQTQRPQDLRLEFVLDATGVTPGVSDVAREIAQFKALAYSYSGDAHSPNFLEIVWGQLVFPCMLASLDIEYVLFAPSGAPVRARLQTVFRESRTPVQVARRASKRSADLTHARTIGAGGSLALECFDVYRDPTFYIDVARANDLDDLSLLRPGTTVRFPPLED